MVDHMVNSFEQPNGQQSGFDPDRAARRVAEEEAANERATRLIKRIGIAALVLLAFWLAAVFYAFMG